MLTFWKIYKRNNTTKKRIVINRGGSSSGKTGTLLRMAFLWLVSGKIDDTEKIFWEKEKSVFTIVRKYSANLTRSVIRDFEKIIDENDEDGSLRKFLQINKTEKTYTLGNRIIEFIGIDDPQKARWPRRDILYCNEANELDYEDFRQLAMRTAYRIFIDFNPDDEDIWINTELEQKRMLTDGDVDLIISTYRDNKFLTPEIVKELERLRDTDPMYWQVYGEWQYGRLEWRIFDFKDIDAVPKSAKLLGYGLDFGFTNDPTACVGVYEYGDTLVLDEVFYERGLTNDDICKKFGENNFTKTDEIWADSSEPKSIEEIYRSGYNIHAVEKWPDSVRFWIDTMKKFEIFVTANSLNLRKEWRKYIWKTDKNGKSLNVPIDDFNHAIDAARYLVMTKKKSLKEWKVMIWKF